MQENLLLSCLQTTRAACPLPRARLPGKLAPAPALPFFLEHFNCRLLQEFRRRPLIHIEVVLDVAVAEHEIFADLDAFQVLRAQARHHVDVLDAFVGVLGIQVEGLAVENERCSALVIVRPAPDLDHGLHIGDDQLGVLLGHHVGAGDDRGGVGNLNRPVRELGQVEDGLDFARGLRELS